MKQYTYHGLYKGQQIAKIVCAKTVKEAAEKLEITPYVIRTYCYITEPETNFDGIIAYYDSGLLYIKCKELIRVKMPLEELKLLVDKYTNE